MRARRFAVAWAATLVLCVLAGADLASAGSSTGYDLSYPQCGSPFPAPGAVSIVGVNGGKPFGVNPCLGTGSGTSELQWAGANAMLYANTADPGPALSSHWPNGQTSPRYCDATNDDTADCAYDYGWNAAADSYADAVNAYISLDWAAPGATRTPQANQWWLDVESANSWTTDTSMNIADLQGGADYLASVGASGVGFYATSADWQTITGATTAFSGDPSWTPGAGTQAQAQTACGGSGVTGGGVALAQYSSGGFDGDLQCVQSPPLSLSASQTSTAGASSGAITVTLPGAVASPVTVSISSSSAAGRFSTNSDASAGTATLALSIPPGSTSASFYYYDTKAGTATLTAAAAGYAGASQTETVTAAALTAISISPAPVQVRVGSSITLTATGSDRFGNAVVIAPTWSVTPSLGSFSSQGSRTTGFRASSVGTGTISALSGSVRGSVAVTVTSKHR